MSLAISITFIVLILKFTINPEEITHLLELKIRYEYFVLAVFVHSLTWFIWGARLKIMSNAVDDTVHVGLWASTKIVIANLFLASITPSMAGGEPIRIHLLTKEGMSIGGATAATLGERLIDAVYILLAVPLAFIVFNSYINDYRIKIGIGIGIAVFIVGIIVFVYAIKKPNKIKSLLIWIDMKASRFSKKEKKKGKLLEKINTEVDNFHQSMVFLLKKKKRTFVVGFVLTVLLWSTAFMVASLILLGLGFNPFLMESYAAQILLLVLVMLPTTPGSSGVAEVSIGGLYLPLIGAGLLGIFVLLFRLATYYTNVIAGAIFQYRIFKSVVSFSMDMVKKK